MLGAISLVSIVLGGTLAYAAGRVPGRKEWFEGSGGAFFVFGVALLGTGLSQYPI
jgi:hypothetical protein